MYTCIKKKEDSTFQLKSDSGKDQTMADQNLENKENALRGSEKLNGRGEEETIELKNRCLVDSKMIPPSYPEQLYAEAASSQTYTCHEKTAEARENEERLYRENNIVIVNKRSVENPTNMAPFVFNNNLNLVQAHFPPAVSCQNNHPVPSQPQFSARFHFLPQQNQRQHFVPSATPQPILPPISHVRSNNLPYRPRFCYRYQTLLKNLAYEVKTGTKKILEEAVQGDPRLMACPEVTYPADFLLSPNAHDGNPIFAKALVDLAIAVKTSILQQSKRSAPSSLYPIIFPLYKLAWDIAKCNPNQRTVEFKDTMNAHWIWWLEAVMKGPYKKPAEKVGPFWDAVRRQLNIQIPTDDDYDRRIRFDDEMFEYEIKWQNRYARVVINRWKW